MNESPRVFLVWRPTPDGRRAAEYAASVARPYGALHVLVSAGTVSSIERVRLMDEVGRWTGTAPSTFGWAHGRVADYFHVGDPNAYDFGDAIVVDGQLASTRRDVTVLAPMFERTLFARGPGPALVPFGDYVPEHRATERGLRTLRALGFDEVVFYHTTWPDEGQASSDPRDHMNAGARALLERLPGLADQASLRHRVVLEMADSVPLGIQRAQLAHGCRLAVLARDPKKFGFTYVDRVLHDNATPVLVLGAHTGES